MSALLNIFFLSLNIEKEGFQIPQNPILMVNSEKLQQIKKYIEKPSFSYLFVIIQ